MAKASADFSKDEGILPRVAQREPNAMRQCIDRFGGLVWTITRRYVPGESDAEDVVQEIFTELWAKADRFDRKRASEATFIGLIARRRSIDWLRKFSRQPSLEPITDEMTFEQPGTSAGPRFDADSIALALRKLPEETRNLFNLHFEQGMTHPEIATKTGLPLGTVKTRLRRGLLEMRSAMGPTERSSA